MNKIAGKTLYIRFFPRVLLSGKEKVTMGKIAEIEGDNPYRQQVNRLPLDLPPAPGGTGKKLVISSLYLVHLVRRELPGVEVQLTGAADIIIEWEKEGRPGAALARSCALPLVCLLLFLGSALAIMNFHADVSMPTVHRQVYYILTGEETQSPLLLQVPYSLGVGLGMSLFFNHYLKNRFNDDPSPLEVEMYLYQDNVNRFLKSRETGIKSEAIPVIRSPRE